MNDPIIKLVYRRLREESQEFFSCDQDYINKVREKISGIHPGEETDLMYCDHSDIIIFEHEDGEKEIYEFEADNLLAGGRRYKAEGDLKGLKILLNELKKEQI